MLPDRMMEEFQVAGDDRTSQDRLDHWAFGMEVVDKFPVLGVGYRNWLDYCNFMNPEGLGTKPKCRIPHNTYVSAASELGVTGFLLYLAMILFIFMQNSRTRRNAKITGNRFFFYTASGLDAGLVGFLVSTFFFSVLFYPVFWVQLALTVSLNKISERQVMNRSALS
jgi:O-antigen ligase